MRASVILVLAFATLLAAAAMASAAVTPLSDSSLSAIAAGDGPGGPGGPGGHGNDKAYDAKVEVEDYSQQYASALNLINAVGPVQAGNNILVLCHGEIEDSMVHQSVMNFNATECSPCEFNDFELKVEVEDFSQQFASAMNLINSGGLVQAGNNLLVLCGEDADIEGSCVMQTVMNSSGQMSMDGPR